MRRRLVLRPPPLFFVVVVSPRVVVRVRYVGPPPLKLYRTKRVSAFIFIFLCVCVCVHACVRFRCCFRVTSCPAGHTLLGGIQSGLTRPGHISPSFLPFTFSFESSRVGTYPPLSPLPGVGHLRRARHKLTTFVSANNGMR